jgi:tripartite-type tricarboxylate transporter receptor subunit TctC
MKNFARNKGLFVLVGLLGLLVLTTGSAVFADNYPAKEIQLIVPFGAGGGTDKVARLVANALEKQLGKPVVVINKNSAGGIIGSNEIAQAKPDGYTLGVFSNTDVAQFVYAVKTGVQFKLNSFTYLAGVNETGNILILPKNSKLKTTKDFVKEAKKKPAELIIALPSKTQNLDLQLMEKAMKIKVTGVVYDGGNKAFADLLGGHVDAAILSAQFSVNAKEQGLDILGVMLDERLETIKEIPTFAEQGYKISNPAARMLVAPKGLPSDVVRNIENALQKAFQGELSQALQKMGETPKYRDMATLAKFLKQDFAMRAKLMK